MFTSAYTSVNEIKKLKRLRFNTSLLLERKLLLGLICFYFPINAERKPILNTAKQLLVKYVVEVHCLISKWKCGSGHTNNY